MPDTFALKTIVDVTEEEPVMLGGLDIVSKPAGKSEINSKGDVFRSSLGTSLPATKPGGGRKSKIPAFAG